MEPDTPYFQQQKMAFHQFLLYDILQKNIVQPLYGDIVDYRHPDKNFPQVSPLFRLPTGLRIFLICRKLCQLQFFLKFILVICDPEDLKLKKFLSEYSSIRR